ncbi:MAG: hypothetical protein CL910_11990 [Deltaproteobacteria bacterium]|nr:hypothetical protein [Deltaproteobacteria bacterium]
MSRAHGSICAAILAGVSGLVLLAASPGEAHTRSTSYSSWEIDGARVRVLFRIPQLELTRLPWGIVSPPSLPPPLGAYLVGALRLEVGGEPCLLRSGPRALSSPPERALIEWELQCPEAPPGEDAPRWITSDVLKEVAPSHLHFARLRGGGGGITERVLNDSERSWRLPGTGPSDPGDAEGSGLLRYIRVGVDHIVTGYDHLVFLLGLLLLARRVGQVVTIVTGFTLAHSLTLALAALGRLQPEAAAVEALIGLSIALVAVENGWVLSGRGRALPAATVVGMLAMAGAAVLGAGAIPAGTLLGLALFTGCYFGLLGLLEAPLRLRTAIAFCFGLIHGFGFAGVLTELALPQGRLIPALLGFNLGVELGQLVLVAICWPVLALLGRFRGGLARRWVVELGTAAVCGLGLYWMVARAFAD